MKYVVVTGWEEEYEFDSAITAIGFAEMAYSHKVNKIPDYKVTIVVRAEEEEEEA